jgi:hypothetical protein
MQRAEKNIDSLLTNMNRTFYRLRKSSIDEELFDVTAGFNAISQKASAGAFNRGKAQRIHRPNRERSPECSCGFPGM